MGIVILLIAFGLGIFAFSWLMGDRKGNIVLELDDRYSDHAKHVEAVKRELIKEGRDVQYIGSGKFQIDGQTYILIERNVSMGPGILQRTILQPDESDLTSINE